MDEAEHGESLKIILTREEQLLKHADEIDHGRVVYGISRKVIADFAHPAIAEYLRKNSSPSILEVGGGKGEAILKILQDHPEIKPTEITMTSLTPLPEHERLKPKGVKVLTGIMAEKLPVDWQEQYDILLTSTVVQWTQINKAVKEFSRVLKTKGIWFGLDDKETVQRASKEALENGFIDVSSQYQFVAPPELAPFVFQKK